ncbi:MAG: hypothetical protein SFU91_04935 [Chloroherpetonaceae bacterium]|nr:hypothetical protein [Chloroherpetonaceae bacterium]
MGKKGNINNLHGIAQFALFVTSYIPLFLLIIFRQLFENFSFLNFSGLDYPSIKLFITKFGLSTFLSLISIFGGFGFWLTLRNIKSVAENGRPIRIKDVKNKNSEAIGYIATYIIPFLFQSFNGYYEFVSVIFLLFIIYRIYINSSLLLINPVLSVFYSIYEVIYIDGSNERNGLIIIEDNYLQDNEELKIYEIGHKLFFAINNSEE